MSVLGCFIVIVMSMIWLAILVAENGWKDTAMFLVGATLLVMIVIFLLGFILYWFGIN